MHHRVLLLYYYCNITVLLLIAAHYACAYYSFKLRSYYALKQCSRFLPIKLKLRSINLTLPFSYPT